jgi:hypothetical protein
MKWTGHAARIEKVMRTKFRWETRRRERTRHRREDVIETDIK